MQITSRKKLQGFSRLFHYPSIPDPSISPPTPALHTLQRPSTLPHATALKTPSRLGQQPEETNKFAPSLRSLNGPNRPFRVQPPQHVNEHSAKIQRTALATQQSSPHMHGLFISVCCKSDEDEKHVAAAENSPTQFRVMQAK